VLGFEVASRRCTGIGLLGLFAFPEESRKSSARKIQDVIYQRESKSKTPQRQYRERERESRGVVVAICMKVQARGWRRRCVVGSVYQKSSPKVKVSRFTFFAQLDYRMMMSQEDVRQ